MSSLEQKVLTMREIGESLAHFRIARPMAERSMQRSLRSGGQLTPVIVWRAEGRYEMVDGFKRLRAARLIEGMESLVAQVVVDPPHTVKRSILLLNRPGSGVSPIEEAWVIRSLIHDDHHSQSDVAALMGKYQTWVSRRLSLVERLESAVQEDVRLGLLPPTLARIVAFMPRGIQAHLATAVRQHGLTSREVEALAVLLKHSPPHTHPDLLVRPREELLRRGASSCAVNTDPRVKVETRQILRRIQSLTAWTSDLTQTLAVLDPSHWTSRERLLLNESLRGLHPSLMTLTEALRRTIVPARAAEPTESPSVPSGDPALTLKTS